MKIPKIEARGASKCTYKDSDDRRTCSRDGFLFRTFKLHNTFHYYRVQDDSDAYVQNKHYKSITRPSPKVSRMLKANKISAGTTLKIQSHRCRFLLVFFFI